MQERILEIIQLLIKEISHVSEPSRSEIEKISRKLVKNGFTEGEVKQAIEIVVTYLKSSIPSSEFPNQRKPALSIRILNEAEKSLFTREAYGLLVQLQSIQLLSPLAIEKIIERILMLGFNQVTVEDLNYLIAHILIGRELEQFGTDAVFHPGSNSIN